MVRTPIKLEGMFGKAFAAARKELDERLPDYMREVYSPIAISAIGDGKRMKVCVERADFEEVHLSVQLSYGVANALVKRLGDYLFAKGYRFHIEKKIG